MTIKPAKLSDIIVINELAHRIWPVAYRDILSPDQMEYMLRLIYSPPSLKKQIQDLHHKFIIVYENKIPVGFASYSLKINSNTVYRLHKIYILQSVQGKGVGKYVLNKIIVDIKSAGAKFLELNVNRNNTALNFYTKNGFKIIAEEDIDIDNGYYMNDYVMRRKL